MKKLFVLFFALLLTPCFSPVPADVAAAGLGVSDLAVKMDREISLDLRDMDVVDVYKFLAMRGGFNASISREISGRVTLYLRNVSIKDALDIISIANDLAYRVIGRNTVYVMTSGEYQRLYGMRFGDKRVSKAIRLNYIQPSYALETLRNLKSDIGRIVIDPDTGSIVLVDTPESIARMEEVINNVDVPLEVYVYDLKYADANDVASKLRVRLDNMGVGSVQPDTRSNRLVVRALPGRMQEVRRIIDGLDTKTKAVLIEVRILKVTLRPGLDMGLDWQVVFNRLNDYVVERTFIATDPIGKFGTVTAIMRGADPYPQMTASDFDFNIRMLKEVTGTQVLANPRLMVTDGEEARIHIGDKLAYVTTTTIGTGDSQRVNEEIYFIDVGVKFRVTPTINDDGFVTMRIMPEISSKSGDLVTPQGARIPLINLTELETEVIVSDGHTIVMAGLRQQESEDRRKGIPWLMDIPYIGNVFADTRKSETMTEIVLLLTPHIVHGTEHYASQQAELRDIKGDYKDYRP